PEDRREIDRLTRVLQERERELEEEKREKEQVRNRLQQQLQGREQQLQQAQQQGQEREREIQQARERERQAREQVQGLQQQLQEKERQLQQAQQQLQSRERESQERERQLQRQVEGGQQREQDLQRQLQQAQQQLRERDREERESSWVVSRNDIRMTERILGRGGWGEVRVARFHGLEVAAKVLHETIISEYNVSLFSREMNIASKIRHPNLLQFIGATTEGNPIILTELMPTSLRKELEIGGVTYPAILSISLDVACALNYLHLFKPHPILHRDVSSANVLLQPMLGVWRAKVSDYGSANLQPLIGRTTNPGNPVYSAPEAGIQGNYQPGKRREHSRRLPYVGSENVNRRRGDAEAEPLETTASKNMRAHKPKAVLGLNLKGVSLYDERSKSITRVPVDKVTYVTHDPEDQCYFGVIIQTKESHTGFRLYCFKAERPIAVTFVNSSRELFDLIMKLRQSAPAPAPTAQSEYMIIPPPAPTGGARTRPQPGVQPPPPSHPPPPANPPPSSSGFDDLSDVFSGSGALTSLYGNQPQAPPTFNPTPTTKPIWYGRPAPSP
ncbi:PREDICTED: dual specificity protein kinase shkB-like, partial [Amphimedon queenslandica]|uniref:Protein kinase domain-containing protein n=1 Tax=Amphimedon queenslandica TaxID=400682 RepID=A0AAN0JG65_AMPQE